MARDNRPPARGQDKGIHERVEEERALAFPDPNEVRIFRDYARGRQRNTLTREQNRALKGARIIIVENVLRRVLRVLTDRIQVTGYQVPATDVEAYLKLVWVYNWLEALYAQVVYATWRDGNGGVSLNWSKSKGRVVITREKWYDGISGIFFGYDDEGETQYAVKEWPEPGGRRRTVWFPGEVRRYVLGREGWRYYTDNRNPKGVTPWKRPDGRDLGIPAVHFARVVEPADSAVDNRDNERDGNYGISMYAGGLLGLQDCVNEILRLILVAGRFTAFQIPTASGLKTKKNDQTGEPERVKVEPGMMLTSEDATTRFGHIPAGNIDQLLAALANFLRAIAAGADVPEHTIRGQWPSGEALMRAEMPLIGAAKKGAAALGPAFASVAHKSVVLSNTFGGTAYNEQAIITTLYSDPARFDLMTLTNLATARAEYVSLAEIHRLMGYTPDQHRQIMTERASEASFRTTEEDDERDLEDVDDEDLAA